MVDYREILRLASLKYSQRMIESSGGGSRHTINAVLTAAKNAGIAWPLDENVTNAMLQATFFPGKYASTSKYAELDYSTIHQELARPGVTLTLLWAEYCRKARDSNGFPYMYTQFCERYRQWARLTKATMRVQHKPVDIYDPTKLTYLRSWTPN